MNATATSLVGAIVRDTTDASRPRYAVGKTGFIILATGDFVAYDSAFNGPDYFLNPAFEVEYAERRAMNEDAAEALDTLHWRFVQFSETKTPVSQAYALTALNDAVSDMITYHPGYEFEREGSFMPWQRNELD